MHWEERLWLGEMPGFHTGARGPWGGGGVRRCRARKEQAMPFGWIECIAHLILALQILVKGALRGTPYFFIVGT